MSSSSLALSTTSRSAPVKHERGEHLRDPGIGRALSSAWRFVRSRTAPLLGESLRITRGRTMDEAAPIAENGEYRTVSLVAREKPDSGDGSEDTAVSANLPAPVQPVRIQPTSDTTRPGAKRRASREDAHLTAAPRVARGRPMRSCLRSKRIATERRVGDPEDSARKAIPPRPSTKSDQVRRSAAGRTVSPRAEPPCLLG